MNKFILRGELYYANLSPVVGSEQGGIRPVLIIQNNVGNRYSPTVIAAAITSKAMKTALPTHCILNQSNGLERDSIVMLEQIRTIDKRRLEEYIGVLNRRDMKKVDRALVISFQLDAKDYYE